MTQEEVQVTVYANKMHQVGELKPVPITVYDYYNPHHKTTVYYQLAAINGDHWFLTNFKSM